MGKIVATPVTKSLYLAYIKTPIIQLEKRQFNKKKKNAEVSHWYFTEENN